MKKIIITFFASIITLFSFGQANTYFHDRIDTTLFAIADTVGHGANHYYATNLTPDFNVKQYVNGCTVNLFFKKGNTGSATLTLVTKTATLSSKTIRKANGQVLLSGDIPDSTAVILDYYNGSFRIAGIGVTASSSSWLLTGNGGTTAGTNFLGTTDAQDIVFKRNSTELGRFSSSGFNLGLASTNNGALIFKNSTNANTLTINSGITSASHSWTLPTAQGAASTFLQNDGAGALSWNNGLGSFWGLTGNSGTNSATNFLGTTDAQDVVFKRNSSEVMRLYSSSNFVGIGTATPTGTLGIKGAGATISTWALYVENSSPVQLFKLFNSGQIGAGVGDCLFMGLNSGSATAGATNLSSTCFGNNTLVDLLNTGGNATAMGNGALRHNSSGVDNTAFGDIALGTETSGSRNTAIGSFCMSLQNGGVSNTALGYNSMFDNTNGSYNTAIGTDALQNITTANFNVAVGRQSQNNTTSGDGNNSFGQGAMVSNTTGTYNNAFGFQALQNNVSGHRNNAFGYYAGAYVTGSDTTMIDSKDRTNETNAKTQTPFIMYTGGADSSANSAKFNCPLTLRGDLKFTAKTINTTAGDAATINSPAGRFRKDASGTVFTLTNSYITANSIIIVTFASDPGVANHYAPWVVAGNGSCTINFDTAPSSNTDVNFIIIN